MTDFKKLKVAELRAECVARSLPQTGKRDDLIERLEEYEFETTEPSQFQEAETSQVSQVREEQLLHELVLVSKPTIISPIPAPTPLLANAETSKIVIPVDQLIHRESATSEEEKLRLRALRFGLNPSEAAPLQIEVTINRLEHALPNRSHHHHHRQRHTNRRHRNSGVKINKP